ncbi:MAG: type IV toxin-antitoxin system AbiEi family antitoxin domain-containing protein [Candidatus Aminicenantes bacterium]|nr:type IV toxin-antitoxin system AbiEi family antitoxin domain-containing protein [Candidatus Aminicenantes bacterium]
MGLTTNKYRLGLSKRGSLLLSTLAREDKNIFRIDEAKKILKEDPKKVLSYLIQKKWILHLKRGLYAIVPLDIGVKGAEDFIVHDFVIASYLTKPYYISFWSALNYHGLSDQIPKSVFIATKKAKKALAILNTEFVFVQLKNSSFTGIEKIEVENQKINISNVNKTVADCLDHPEHSGGIEEVARAIYFNHNELDLNKVKNYSLKMNNVTILKRLGYILEKTVLLGKYKDVFKDIPLTKGYSMFDTISKKKGKYNEKWKLNINVDISPQRWMY